MQRVSKGLMHYMYDLLQCSLKYIQSNGFYSEKCYSDRRYLCPILVSMFHRTASAVRHPLTYPARAAAPPPRPRGRPGPCASAAHGPRPGPSRSSAEVVFSVPFRVWRPQGRLRPWPAPAHHAVQRVTGGMAGFYSDNEEDRLGIPYQHHWRL